jgi:hypothetical protein
MLILTKSTPQYIEEVNDDFDVESLFGTWFNPKAKDERLWKGLLYHFDQLFMGCNT